jgi:hypothetical protein
MGIRDYFKGGPVVRNERVVRSIAMASHDRMSEVRAPMVVAEGVVREPTVSRGNLTHTASGLRRWTHAQEHANDNAPLKAPANDREHERRPRSIER